VILKALIALFRIGIFTKHPMPANPISKPSRKVRLSMLRCGGEKNEMLPNLSPFYMVIAIA